MGSARRRRALADAALFLFSIGFACGRVIHPARLKAGDVGYRKVKKIAGGRWERGGKLLLLARLDVRRKGLTFQCAGTAYGRGSFSSPGKGTTPFGCGGRGRRVSGWRREYPLKSLRVGLFPTATHPQPRPVPALTLLAPPVLSAPPAHGPVGLARHRARNRHTAHSRTGEATVVRRSKGRTTFPFGHGLSYTTFAFGKPTLDRAQIAANQSAKFAVTVTNSGSRAGDHVVQMYVHHPVSASFSRRARCADSSVFIWSRTRQQPSRSRSVPSSYRFSTPRCGRRSSPVRSTFLSRRVRLRPRPFA